MPPRRQTSDATLSDDDDDDDDASISFSRLQSFMPVDADDESIIPVHTDDATIDESAKRALPNRAKAREAIRSDVKFAQVIDPDQAKRFLAAPIEEIVEETTPPGIYDVGAKYVTWTRKRVVFHEKLVEEPWYRLAMLTAAYAGVSIDDLVHIPSLTPRRRVTRPFGYGSYNSSILNRLSTFTTPEAQPGQKRPAPEEDEEESEDSQLRKIRQPRSTTSEPEESPRRSTRTTTIPPTPSDNNQSKDTLYPAEQGDSTRRGDVGNPRAAPRQLFPDEPTEMQYSVSGPSMFGPSSEYRAMEEKLRKDLAAAIKDNASPATMAELARREELLAMLRRVESGRPPAAPPAGAVDDPRSTGLVFFNPAYPANQLLARDLIRSQYPQTLRYIEVEHFEKSETAATFFALISASLLSRGYFVGGRRLLRASDMNHYTAAISRGLHEMRFAYFNEITKTVEIRLEDVATFRNAAAARTPHCQGSLGYSTTPYSSRPMRATLPAPERRPSLGIPFGGMK